MCKLINKYSKTGNLKYISHLDVLRFIQRAVKRTGLPAKYSEGFNPHMKTAFGYPLSLGTESIGEYFELEFNEHVDPEDFVSKMNKVLPKEMQIQKSMETDEQESIMSRCAYAEYIITLESETMDADNLNILFNEMLETGLVYPRQKKNKKNKTVIKDINTLDYIKYLKAERLSEGKLKVEAVFLTTETGSMKVDELLKLMEERGFTADYHSIMKIDALDKNMQPIL
ncbi:TIGR03936 family radical SAM-associated protein [Sedimentibacter saalensis]|jgi:radical SAM-linked protein|uniref:Radical SAM-linked protein n=1 Tax=Sedimentibacter saalensis TaxID=130788 RepID=A0A562J364_9FIRM|nr:TIGR03936 family radical SAM-associated protein [Sedimentibacter saalensis]MEA5096407.1 TIGR03936 family radical SAM-associated protein [Sedimentibacter saalensis]TWH77587.1 radical SAM-linked protein [Sedimentibacter saalensis]